MISLAMMVMVMVSAAAATAAAQQPPELEPAADATVEAEAEPVEPTVTDTDASYTPAAPPAAASGFSVNGYVDVGFARAQGNGTSFASGDTRLPVDYGVDTFATAVNSRGEVASTNTDGRFDNGFMPRSVGIGNRPSFLINTATLDLKYEPTTAPVTVFSRVALLPRFTGGNDGTEVLLEQAFGRIQPFSSQEMTITAGKFDSVFGIEYLENQSNFRTGITPSLLARYTTGTSIGAKAFYRLQVAPLWSAFSLNVAATNSGNFVDTLQAPDRSLTGKPVASARFGYELNLDRVGVKLGASGLYGPRNDQEDVRADQRMWGVDARVNVWWISLAGEYLQVDEGIGDAEGKTTALGDFPLASGFHARGFYGTAAFGVPVKTKALRKVTAYGRYEQRNAWFTGFNPLLVDRVTAGLRLDLWEFLMVKAEYLLNRELKGAPRVDNDVLTSSLVFAW